MEKKKKKETCDKMSNVNVMNTDTSKVNSIIYRKYYKSRL